MRPQTNLRLRASEQELLDALAADMDCTRTDAVRVLMRQEAERRGLLDAAGGAFLNRLASEYGSASDLKIVLDSGAVVQATIAGRQGDDFRVELVHDRGGRADVLLEDPSSAATVLITGVVRPRPGLELTIEVPLAFLREAS